MDKVEALPGVNLCTWVFVSLVKKIRKMYLIVKYFKLLQVSNILAIIS